MQRRQVALDIETTGKSVVDGHRIIEVACVEILGRRLTGNTWVSRINPGRPIDAEASQVHGIRDVDIKDSPAFADVAASLLQFVGQAQLIIHNAEFDLSFLRVELARCGCSLPPGCEAETIDTLAMARKRHPGQRNSLDALCSRYDIDRSSRVVHGALVDAELLARVYLAMTGGQSAMELPQAADEKGRASSALLRHLAGSADRPLPVIKASPNELASHRERMEALRKIQLAPLARKAREAQELLERSRASTTTPDADLERLEAEAQRARADLERATNDPRWNW